MTQNRRYTYFFLEPKGFPSTTRLLKYRLNTYLILKKPDDTSGSNLVLMTIIGRVTGTEDGPTADKVSFVSFSEMGNSRLSSPVSLRRW